jgi:hypothetical protein
MNQTAPHQAAAVPQSASRASRLSESIWPWLIPIAYLLHVTEEYLAGVALAPSAQKIRGANMTAGQFLVINTFTMALMLLGLWLARRLRFLEWLLVCVGTVLFINGVFHIKGTIKIAAYNPGLYTGALLFIPLGALTALRFRNRPSPRKYLLALLVGALIYVVVLIVARSGRKLFEM